MVGINHLDRQRRNVSQAYAFISILKCPFESNFKEGENFIFAEVMLLYEALSILFAHLDHSSIFFYKKMLTDLGHHVNSC